MTDNATGEAVFRLVYRSHLTLPDDQHDDEVSRILAVARKKNPEHGITGALVVWDDSVVQTLEGEESAVRRLYEIIGADPRHERVEIIDTQSGVDRAFARWSMAWVSDDDQPDLPLNMRQREASTDVQSPRFISPEEDAAVRAMRDRVRGASA